MEIFSLTDSGTTSDSPVCVVSVRTTRWHDDRGLNVRRSLRFLKRKSVGHNFLDEDARNSGAENVLMSIVNLDRVKDGEYEVVIVNRSRDFETGEVDDYDYVLVPLKRTAAEEG